MSKTLEAYLLAALLIAVAIGVVGLTLILWRRMPQKTPTQRAAKQVPLGGQNRKDRPDWPLGIGVVIIMFAFFSWLDTRDERIRLEMEAQGQIRALINAGYLHPDRAWFKANLNDCGPRTDAMTDQVVMVITTEADGQHKAAGCTRIAHRQYITAKGITQ